MSKITTATICSGLQVGDSGNRTGIKLDVVVVEDSMITECSIPYSRVGYHRLRYRLVSHGRVYGIVWYAELYYACGGGSLQLLHTVQCKSYRGRTGKERNNNGFSACPTVSLQCQTTGTLI